MYHYIFAGGMGQEQFCILEVFSLFTVVIVMSKLILFEACSMFLFGAVSVFLKLGGELDPT